MVVLKTLISWKEVALVTHITLTTLQLNHASAKVSPGCFSTIVMITFAISVRLVVNVVSLDVIRALAGLRELLQLTLKASKPAIVCQTLSK